MNRPGIGVLISMLGGYKEDAAAVQSCIGKKISSLSLNVEEELKIGFEDGTALVLWDDGQSCCEHRYMRTDDDLLSFIGDALIGIELRDGPDEESEYGEIHEIQYLHVNTSGGAVVCSSHNEHNGYYGGFAVRARLEASP